ncbi:MAG: nitrous oxide-stimulated promoter family protein [Planctomycetes bacterium]|nr:nitrous oxide-stimulated promoter family protein [Planctomycetota bacterium]
MRRPDTNPNVNSSATPGGAPGKSAPEPDPDIDRDLSTLIRFVDIYCKHKHREAEKHTVHIKGFDMTALCKQPCDLCNECTKVLTHALVKRSHCPLDPKPACKHCQVHCYHPDYRARIREIMKYSGRRLVLSGRLDLLYHLLF